MITNKDLLSTINSYEDNVSDHMVAMQRRLVLIYLITILVSLTATKGMATQALLHERSTRPLRILKQI